MLNIEKYKDEILKYAGYRHSLMCLIYENIMKKNDCTGCCSKCKRETIKWLTSEYEEPILDDIEKEYLSAVIKPFRKRIKSIKKAYCSGNSAYIGIAMDKCEHIYLPYFNLNSGMYKRMEIDKEYTLKDLGL